MLIILGYRGYTDRHHSQFLPTWALGRTQPSILVPRKFKSWTMENRHKKQILPTRQLSWKLIGLSPPKFMTLHVGLLIRSLSLQTSLLLQSGLFFLLKCLFWYKKFNSEVQLHTSWMTLAFLLNAPPSPFTAHTLVFRSPWNLLFSRSSDPVLSTLAPPFPVT